MCVCVYMYTHMCVYGGVCGSVCVWAHTPMCVCMRARTHMRTPCVCIVFNDILVMKIRKGTRIAETFLFN